MRISKKSSLAVWTGEETKDEALYESELYEREEVDSLLDELENKIGEALKEIEKIEGIDLIDNCKEILSGVLGKFY